MAYRYLIINADDFGLCSAANEAIFELFKGGWLKSSTIMMPCKYAEEAARFAVENPQYAIGVHLTTTNEWPTYKWAPLTDGTSLRNADGWMWSSSVQFSKNAVMSEVKEELAAQLNKAKSLGMQPSHLDNHMGSLYGNRDGRFTMLAQTLKFCASNGYAFRLFSKADKRVCPKDTPYPLLATATYLIKVLNLRHKVIMPDYLLFPDWTDDSLRESYEHYREVFLNGLINIPDGITETFVHPCVEDDEMKEVLGKYWRDRVWEYNVMKDPVTHHTLKAHGIELINYRDLVRMKRR